MVSARRGAPLAYISVDEIAKQVVELGRGARMAKMDIKSAYPAKDEVEGENLC